MLVTIWKYSNNTINIFILFCITFGLFIGGSFIACTFLPDLDPFRTSFFYSYDVSYQRKIEIMWYVYGFMLCSTIGYACRKKENSKPAFIPKEPSLFKNTINHFLSIIFPVAVMIQVFYSIFFIRQGLTGGYLEHFLSAQNGEYSGTSLGGLLRLFISFFLGISIAYGNIRNRRNFIILFVIYSITDLLVGSRSAFGVILLVLLWIYSENHMVNFGKLFALLGISLAIMLFLFSFSVRASNSEFSELSATEMVSGFLYSTGGSLMVFDASRLVDNYPILAYLQCFVPGVSRVYSLITSTTLNPWDISFSSYMCNSLNAKLFSEGAGLGWTLLSDIYLLSGKIYLLFLFFSFLWGVILSDLEEWSHKYLFYRFLLFSLASTVLLIPRNSISGFFPFIIYMTLFWYALKIFSKSNRSKFLKHQGNLLYHVDMKE